MNLSELIIKHKNIKKFKIKFPNLLLLVVLNNGETEEIKVKDLSQTFKNLNKKEFVNKEFVVVDTRNNDVNYIYYLIGDEKYNNICKITDLNQRLTEITQQKVKKFKFGAKLRIGVGEKFVY